MRVCTWLNIYPDYIEDAGESLNALMKELNITDAGMDTVWDEVRYYVSQNVNGEQITNSVISSIFDCGIINIMRLRPELNEQDFDYYVNGMDSHLYYKREEY